MGISFRCTRLRPGNCGQSVRGLYDDAVGASRLYVLQHFLKARPLEIESVKPSSILTAYSLKPGRVRIKVPQQLTLPGDAVGFLLIAIVPSTVGGKAWRSRFFVSVLCCILPAPFLQNCTLRCAGLSRMSQDQPFVRIYASSLSSNETSVSAKLTLTTYFPCR